MRGSAALPPAVQAAEIATGSNWNRPGEEWGSSFVFAEPGCWQIRASRESDVADLWIVLSN